jgi:hypothetical protein
MKMKPLMLLSILGIVALVAGTANATLGTWTDSYEADDLPQDAPLPWGRGAAAPFSENNNFDGTVTITGGNGGGTAGVSYWLLNGSGAGAGKVGFSAGGSIEWRLEPDGSGNISFMHIGDGTYEYTVGAYPGYYAYKDTSLDWVWEPGAGHTAGWDIYRLDLNGGSTAAFYLNDTFVVDIPGFVGTNPGDPPNNFGVHEQIYWGTDPDWGSGGAADWDYIRWDVVPEPATMVLLGLGGLLIRRKRSAGA